MKVRAIIAAGLVPLAVATAVGSSGQASAEQSWVMPDVEGMILRQADDTIAAATDNVGFVVNTTNTMGPAQKQLNQTNWMVCWQSPKPGQPVTEQTWVGVGVARPSGSCY